ncbi:MAG: PH domain-containing protein, partial [Jiangellaceae bacterium]
MIVLVVRIWGLTWMLGLLASLRTYPHVVGGSGLRIRYGTAVDITVPWDAVASIGVRRRDLPSSLTVQLSRLESGTVLQVGISSQTNVDLGLR